jgi:hypothetical protein
MIAAFLSIRDVRYWLADKLEPWLEPCMRRRGGAGRSRCPPTSYQSIPTDEEEPVYIQVEASATGQPPIIESHEAVATASTGQRWIQTHHAASTASTGRGHGPIQTLREATATSTDQRWIQTHHAASTASTGRGHGPIQAPHEASATQAHHAASTTSTDQCPVEAPCEASSGSAGQPPKATELKEESPLLPQ